MTRILQPELLDELPSTDPRAIHSRRDLRRINRLMRNARPIISFVCAFVQNHVVKGPLTVAEIGAGDGYISSQLAGALSRRGISGELLLIDRQPSSPVPPRHWKSDSVQADIFEWLGRAPRVQVIVANLFLHHFSDPQLRDILGRCAGLCECFAASEPRRSTLAEWFSRRVKLIGCNDLTRHDAEISVRAGFNGSELTALWPATPNWAVTERRAGLFTHFFGAARQP